MLNFVIEGTKKKMLSETTKTISITRDTHFSKTTKTHSPCDRRRRIIMLSPIRRVRGRRQRFLRSGVIVVMIRSGRHRLRKPRLTIGSRTCGRLVIGILRTIRRRTPVILPKMTTSVWWVIRRRRYGRSRRRHRRTTVSD